MATYLPRITDYIPHIQPFKPDYNFYQKALEVKEGQYKAGYDKISNLYGTLLNSEMLREPDKKKRDQFFEQVQNDVQRMSTVDLSLEENINTAYSVFQPLIDDKNITNDMAWTKMYRNQKQKSDYFRNCLDEKECGGKWWKEGDLDIDYLAQEFSESDDNSALKFERPRYVPFVNATEKAFDLIKDLAPNVQNVSQDASGKWIYTTKNGAALTGPLYDYLTGIIGNDPKINDVYGVKARLARRSYAEDNAKRLGSKEAAESEYLRNMTAEMDSTSKNSGKRVSNILNLLNGRSNALAEYFQQNGANIEQDKAKLKSLADVKEESALLKIAKEYYKKTEDSVSGDLEQLDKNAMKRRVDYSVASGLLNKDMMKASVSYASTHSSTEIKANPYTMAAMKHEWDLEKEQRGYLHDFDKMVLKYQLEENGTSADPRNNTLTPGTSQAGNTDPDAPLGTVADETMAVVEGNYMDNTSASLKLVAQQLQLAAKDRSTPAKADQANLLLKDIFRDLLDANGELKEDFEKDLSFSRTTSPNYYQNVLDRAAKAMKTDHVIFDANAKDKFGNLLKKNEQLSEQFGYFDDDIKFNNKEVVKFIKNQHSRDESTKSADYLLKPDGHVRSHAEFNSAMWKASRKLFDSDEDFYDYTREAFDELSERFGDNMNNNKDLPLRNVNLSGYLANGGGGMKATPMKWRFDGSAPNSLGFTNTMSAVTDINNAISVKEGSNHTAEQAQVDEEGPRNLANLLMEEGQTGRYKQRKKTPPVAYIEFAAIGGRSRRTSAYVFDPSTEWLNSITDFSTSKGAKIPSGPAAFLWDAETNDWKTDRKFTAYVDAASASSTAAQATKAPISYWDIKIKKGPIALSEPEGGQIKFTKAGGGYAISGSLLAFDNGKMVSVPLDSDLTAYNRTSGLTENVQNMAARLKEQVAANRRMEFNYYASQGKMNYDELKQEFPEFFPE